ncbi:MAG TPA: GIY-YIG nuclease family protein [Flavisolibacter sp.]|nr:GIY-YIG nuclease family protein [Flavisolibacter sp.]
MYYIYILTNLNRTVLYTGVTNDLRRRILQHYANRGKKTSFAGLYHVHYLLYYECFAYITDAIAREKEIKAWRREKKMKLINTTNPGLEFLNTEWFDEWPPKDS